MRDRRRERLFLRFHAGLTAIMLLLGLWEWRIAGAVHSAVLGLTMAVLTAAAAYWWRSGDGGADAEAGNENRSGASTGSSA
jgi:hypothetical protein